MLYSKEIMESLKGFQYNCIFSTNNFHVFRAGLYAKIVGLNSQGIGSKQPFIIGKCDDSRVYCYFRYESFTSQYCNSNYYGILYLSNRNKLFVFEDAVQFINKKTVSFYTL